MRGGFDKRSVNSPRKQALLRWFHQVWNAGSVQGAVIHKNTLDVLATLPLMTVMKHGAKAADDKLRDVQTLSVIGGMSAPFRQIAEIAAARTGEDQGRTGGASSNLRRLNHAGGTRARRPAHLH